MTVRCHSAKREGTEVVGKFIVGVCTFGFALSLAACNSKSSGGNDGGTGGVPEKCVIPDGTTPTPDFVQTIGCQADFALLSSPPLNASIPGARSGKVVYDFAIDQQIYFQNSNKFKIHYDFASKYLSGPSPISGVAAHPLIQSLSEFNTQYTSGNRRFLLGALTHYEGPDIWALEIAPYDTANVDMIVNLYNKVKGATYLGSKLFFHPTSEAVQAVANGLPKSVPVKTTDEIFASIDYQPLNLGTTVGKIRFVNASSIDTAYVGFRDIVVLDHIPNDISVVAGMITQDFQTPLSHVNVLSQNRGTPNMGLRKATTNAKLRALEGQWATLTVGAQGWDAVKASDAEADAFWETHKPAPITVPVLDVTKTELANVQDLVNEKAGGTLKDQIKTAVMAYGTKASNYGVLYNTMDVPIRPGFAIPVYYYVQFMTQNGFFNQVDALLADSNFVNDPAVRDTKLAALRDAIVAAPVDATFSAKLRAKLTADYPGMTMRFRTSTNAEDLDGFPCAGCYDSHTGDPADWEGSLLKAIKKAWSGVWYFRTFEERRFHSIDHKLVGMALLVHHNFPKEEANGVAVTNNPYDTGGLEPAFFVNVQTGGDAEVVAPPVGVTSDQFLYFYYYENSPVTYLGHSNLIPAGQTVLTNTQILELGKALDAIHKRFSPAYGPVSGYTGWYGMDVEFKYEDEDMPGMPPHLRIKQARPYHGREQM